MYSEKPETKPPLNRGGILRATFAHLAVFLIYLTTLFFAVTAPLVRKVLHLKTTLRSPGEKQILVTGTFYNEGWIRGHLVPLTMAQTVEKVWVVCDKPWFPLEKVHYVIPHPWLRRACGRSLSRIITVLTTAYRQKPDLLMGYHIMPNSLICLVAASLFGTHSAYQMTGGPIQVIGGGYKSENSLLRLLGRKSAFLEQLLFSTIRHFDLVVVRGQNALNFARQHNFGQQRIVITAGINTDVFRQGGRLKKYDAICVSRLISGKGLAYLIEVIKHCHRNGYKLKVAIVGDGPIKQDLSETIVRYDLQEHILLLGQRSDISSLLKTAKIFILTSETEGMSIALLEALAAGLPAAIIPVGDLGDAVHDGINGIFLDSKDPTAAALTLTELLGNNAVIKAMSEQARRIAEDRYSIMAIAKGWDNYMIGMIHNDN